MRGNGIPLRLGVRCGKKDNFQVWFFSHQTWLKGPYPIIELL